MKIGYLRVSREDQDEARQVDGLEAICDELHVERVSAAAAKRPVFDAVIGGLVAGDSLVVWDLDRAFRSVVDMLLCLEDLDRRGVKFQIVNLGVDTATESGELVATMMAAVARFERRLIGRRTQEGMRAQQRRGKHVGRPRALDSGQISKAREEIEAGRETVSSMAGLLKVDRRTLGRALKAETPKAPVQTRLTPKTGEQLQAARKAASARYAEMGRKLIAEAGLTEDDVIPHLGRAYADVEDQKIRTPWPTTTKKRVITCAHECGHIILHTTGRKHRYIEEFEAIQYSMKKAKEFGIAFSRDELAVSKAYVRKKIRQGRNGGLKTVDAAIERWANS